MSELHWLNTTYACGAVFVSDGTISDSCPIYKWMRGKPLKFVLNYLRRKKQLVECVIVKAREEKP